MISKSFRFRVALYSAALLFFAFLVLCAEIVQSAQGRIFRRHNRPAQSVQTVPAARPAFRQPAQHIRQQHNVQQPIRQINYVRPTTVAATTNISLPPQNFSKNPPTTPAAVRQIIPMNFDDFCNQIKAEVNAPTENDLARCKNRLINTANALTWALHAGANRQANYQLRQDLKLDDLLKTLADKDGPNDEVLQDVWQAMHSDSVAQNANVFKNLKNELRRYQTIKASVDGNDFQASLAHVCDNLTQYINEYSKNANPAYGTALSDAVAWLSDLSVVNPKTQALAQSTLNRISQVNVKVNAGQRFVGVPFATLRTEPVDVNNVINGARVVGGGSVTARSQGVLVPRSNGAEIAVIVNGSLNTTTSGRQSIVSLNTQANGNLRGEKRVQIFPNYIGVTPATAGATLSSRIYNVRVNAGPVITCIAKKQVDKRKGAAEDVARENARQQFAGRLNQQVDNRIAQLNRNYQTQLRTPLIQSGLYPRILNISSSNTHANASFLIGDSTQPGAANGAPLYRHQYDVFVQCHQSAANNLASIFLSGKSFDEDKVADNAKQFKRLTEIFNLKREPDQPPLTINFAEKTPVALSFENNQVKLVARVDDFIQDGTRYPGLDITLLYDIKMETDHRNCIQVVFEQAEDPLVLPRGFDPSKGRRVSARVQAIRTVVVKRLNEALPKRIVAQPQTLQGEWAGAGELVPVFATSQDGWINFAWNWVSYRR